MPMEHRPQNRFSWISFFQKVVGEINKAKNYLKKITYDEKDNNNGDCRNVLGGDIRSGGK